MKSVAKGNKFELEAKKTLEALGWKVFRQHRKPLFIKGKMVTIGADVFGCDLIAKAKGNKTLWVQVSTKENLSAKKTQVLEHPVNVEYETYEIWTRSSGVKEFEVYRLFFDTIEGTHKWIKLPEAVKIQEKPNV